MESDARFRRSRGLHHPPHGRRREMKAGSFKSALLAWSGTEGIRGPAEGPGEGEIGQGDGRYRCPADATGSASGEKRGAGGERDRT
jgi:hypothetical protein